MSGAGADLELQKPDGQARPSVAGVGKETQNEARNTGSKSRVDLTSH